MNPHRSAALPPRIAPFVGVVLAPADNHVVVVAGATADVAERVPAQELVAAATGAMGGGGGGHPETAQGRGIDPGKLDQAVEAVRERLAESGLAVSTG